MPFIEGDLIIMYNYVSGLGAPISMKISYIMHNICHIAAIICDYTPKSILVDKYIKKVEILRKVVDSRVTPYFIIYVESYLVINQVTHVNDSLIVDLTHKISRENTDLVNY